MMRPQPPSPPSHPRHNTARTPSHSASYLALGSSAPSSMLCCRKLAIRPSAPSAACATQRASLLPPCAVYCCCSCARSGGRVLGPPGKCLASACVVWRGRRGAACCARRAAGLACSVTPAVRAAAAALHAAHSCTRTRTRTHTHTHLECVVSVCRAGGQLVGCGRRAPARAAAQQPAGHRRHGLAAAPRQHDLHRPQPRQLRAEAQADLRARACVCFWWGGGGGRAGGRAVVVQVCQRAGAYNPLPSWQHRALPSCSACRHPPPIAAAPRRRASCRPAPALLPRPAHTRR
jgi:hypothetical protein